MKAISLRLDDKLGRELDRVCKETGYKKNTLITRLVDAFIRFRHQQPSQKGSADPFSRAIGMMDLPPLLDSSDAIDKAVYNL